MAKYQLHNLINIIIPLTPLLQSLQNNKMLGMSEEQFLKQMRQRLLDGVAEIDRILKLNHE